MSHDNGIVSNLFCCEDTRESFFAERGVFCVLVFFSVFNPVTFFSVMAEEHVM